MRLKNKLSKDEDKKKFGVLGYNLKKQQEQLFDYLGIEKDDKSNQKEGDGSSSDEQKNASKQHYVEYNKAYQNLHSQSEGDDNQSQASKESARETNNASRQLQNSKSLDDASRDDLDAKEFKKDSIDYSKGSIFQALENKKVHTPTTGISKKKKANIVNKQLKKSSFRSQENSDIEEFTDGDIMNDGLENQSSQYLYEVQNLSRQSDANNKSNIRSRRKNTYSQSGRDYDDDDEDDEEGGDSLVQETDHEELNQLSGQYFQSGFQEQQEEDEEVGVGEEEQEQEQELKRQLAKKQRREERKKKKKKLRKIEKQQLEEMFDDKQDIIIDEKQQEVEQEKPEKKEKSRKHQKKNN